MAKAAERVQEKEPHMAVAEKAKEVQKSYGDDVIVSIGDQEMLPPVSTGLLTLDWATVVGGIPRGGMTLIYGPRSCGKTHLAKQITAQFQREFPDHYSAWIVSEGEFDSHRAGLLGVDLDRTLRMHTSELETAMDLVRNFVREGGCNPIVIDSISNLSPRAVMEQKYIGEKESIGRYSRRMAEALRQLATDALRHQTSIIFLSHVISSPDPYQKRYQFHGGNAMEHNCLMIVEARQQAYIDENFAETPQKDVTFGKKVFFRIEKNKRGPEGRQATSYLLWDSGFDPVADCVLFAESFKILKTAGSWVSLPDAQGKPIEVDGRPMRWQGKANVIADLKEHPERFAALKERVELFLLTEGQKEEAKGA